MPRCGWVIIVEASLRRGGDGKHLSSGTENRTCELKLETWLIQTPPAGGLRSTTCHDEPS